MRSRQSNLYGFGPTRRQVTRCEAMNASHYSSLVWYLWSLIKILNSLRLPTKNFKHSPILISLAVIKLTVVLFSSLTMSKYLKSIMLSLPIIKSKPDHSPLPDSDPLLHDDELEKSSLTPRRLKINGRHIWVTVLQVALVVFVVATCVATTAYFTKLPTDRQCARKLSTYCKLQ